MEKSKSETLNSKQTQNSNDQNSKLYDLERRTEEFAREIIIEKCRK
ncbi:hypothetical protein LM599_05640 [Candidatus Acetothermia bacterium]|jgi:hypothetical protein|nr:hypothetical protein [Candidatus Acetothermia bacterium]MCI2427237.1 hypothetical protein [Candidatus Acetothermia bacterium]MCI2428749.1 hypothetical protein [Candidatus Acetothermia bacterium]